MKLCGNPSKYMNATCDIYSVLDKARHFPLNSADYLDRMLHQIPDAVVVDRARFIVAKCNGRRVLNLGSASGQLHYLIKQVATGVVGVDRVKGSDVVCDLDENPNRLLEIVPPEIVVCGEIIEHLANPGNLLKTLRKFACPVLITVPNAFSSASAKHLQGGYENVNLGHVAWYSWRTLKTLVERYKFAVKEFHYYGGIPRTSEGLIMVVI